MAAWLLRDLQKINMIFIKDMAMHLYITRDTISSFSWLTW